MAGLHQGLGGRTSLLPRAGSLPAREGIGGSSIPPPRFLFVEINKRCNLRCGHCDFWMRDDDDRANYMSWPRKRELLAEFAEMNPLGTIVICGGEPMLDLEDYFAVTRTGRQLGLKVVSVVNGTRIRTDAMADRLMREGPHEISISLNAPNEALHDKTRGVKGAFKKAVKALRLLVAARDRNPAAGGRVYVMGLIFDQNYRDIDAFYDLVLNDIKADKLKLNFLQPTFGQMGETSEFFAEHGHVDPDELDRQITACNAKYNLGLNPVWQGQVKMYFQSLNAARDLDKGWSSAARTSEHICNTYERNIMVNHYGVARLCFSSQFRGVQLQKRGDLRSFWENCYDVRAAMRSCNQFCGISHSVRRESSTHKSASASPRGAATTGIPSLASLMQAINNFR